VKSASKSDSSLAVRLLDALPQTQCTRCGYPDCAGYANAIANGEADINQCPPGGAEGVSRLAHLTGHSPKSLDPSCGQETPRHVVFIDESWCIGCTLCRDVCPTDAIFGINKRMHTVIESYCTGCDLCLPVCPVDCIILENISDTMTGWDAWTSDQADLARQRYALRSVRRSHELASKEQAQHALAQLKLKDLATHSRITDSAILDKKKAIIEAAMARAKAKRAQA
jgi:electron transport complex protein RnfB